MAFVRRTVISLELRTLSISGAHLPVGEDASEQEYAISISLMMKIDRITICHD